MISKFPEQLVLPFLWAQDGFGEPSDEMAEVDNDRNGHNQLTGQLTKKILVSKNL